MVCKNFKSYIVFYLICNLYQGLSDEARKYISSITFFLQKVWE